MNKVSPCCAALLENLYRLDVRVVAMANGNLKFYAPKGIMTDELKAHLTSHKPEIMRWLAEPDVGTA